MKKGNKQSGFSILEIIVIVFIVSLGLLGILSLTTQNIRVQYINKNNLIASQLAQEGLELVRNIRDTNWTIEGSNWDTGLSAGTFKIDFDDNALQASSMEDAKLYIDGSGRYQHSILTATNFNRLITISNMNPDNFTITCEVQWRERNNTFKYIAETVLYDWR